MFQNVSFPFPMPFPRPRKMPISTHGPFEDLPDLAEPSQKDQMSHTDWRLERPKFLGPPTKNHPTVQKSYRPENIDLCKVPVGPSIDL